MDDDMMSKIQQLRDMLNNNPDNLKNMMSLMSNNSNQDSSSQDNQEIKEQKSTASIENINPEVMISKLKKIMDKKKQMSDPRLTLLGALKPYLGQKRQTRLDSCSQLLNMTLLASLLKDDENL